MRHRVSLVVLGVSLGAASLTHCSVVNDLDALGEGSRVDGGQGLDARVIGSTDSGTALADASEPTPEDSGDHGDSASPPVDADADAADAAPLNDPPQYVDAGTTTFCSARASSTFCADFDRLPLPSGFNSGEGAFMSLTSTRPSSAPNDLAMVVPPNATIGTYSSKLTKNFTESASKIDLAFDFNPELVNVTASGLLFVALDFVRAPTKYSIRLAYNQGAVRLEESTIGTAGGDVPHTTFNLPPQTWTRVRIVVTLAPDGGASAYSLYLNNVLQGVEETLSPPPAMDSRPALLMGAVYGTNPQSGWIFRYDNVTLDIQ